jgi:hypothetical protein
MLQRITCGRRNHLRVEPRTMSGWGTGKILIRQLLRFLPWNIRQGGRKRRQGSHPKAGRLDCTGSRQWQGIPGHPRHGNNRRAARGRGPRPQRHASMGKGDAVCAGNVARHDARNCRLRRNIAKQVAAAQRGLTADSRSRPRQAFRIAIRPAPIESFCFSSLRSHQRSPFMDRATEVVALR